jgi:LysR family transcriptional regulator, glycine cleavage system transcriptional activator
MIALARLVPSLRSLLIFESVARSGSCSAAAREFNLTQPSASRNIAQLETHLGVVLFTRTAAGMALTREGQMLYQALGDGFHRVEAALQELSALRDRKDMVELSLSTAFVTHWLVPRLSSFYQAFPSVDLRFQLIPSNLRGGPGQVDLAMRMKGENDADYHSWHFAPELIIPVCSPSYLMRHKPLSGVPGESGHTLLHLSDAHFDPQTLWGATKVPIARQALLEFSDYAVVLQAALNGGGVAPGWISVVSRPLSEGTLVPASPLRVRTGKHFHLLASRSKPLRDIVVAIRDWLLGQMRQDMEHVAALIDFSVEKGSAG